MNDWIFLSNDKEDPYVNMLAKSCDQSTIDPDEFIFEDSSGPIVLRGIGKKKIMHKCWRKERTFFYMDTGFFGNERTNSNPNAWKFWHRIIKNDLQPGSIVERPSDRFTQFGKKFKPWKTNGRKILIAKPDEKPMKFYGLDLETWLEETIATIKKYTDRPIEVRDRAAQRYDRVFTSTLQEALDDDVFALVTFNSNAAVESVFHGIPVFTLAPANAAAPVGLQDLSKIETPYYPDKDTLFAWGCHLAYNQFHVVELKNGKAVEILKEAL